MPTIVDITEQELAELKAFTKESDTVATVRLAMMEYLRLARRMQLKAMSGQVEVAGNWQSLEAAEMRDSDNS
jgi:hypothetical protein